MLLCTVRDCRQPLTRLERRLTCSQGHSFDIASKGYVNLLQPQDKRSRNPGDSRTAVAARRRLHDLGVTAPLLEGIRHGLGAAAGDVVLDAGCGEGFYLGTLAAETGFSAHGVDISTPAVEAAARRFPAVQWVVANADRFLPYADRTFTRVLSVTARMNCGEFYRVLQPGGRLLVAVPAPNDLIELRGPTEAGTGDAGRDRVPRTVEQFRDAFQLQDCTRVSTIADLTSTGVEDVLLSIYRPMRKKAARAMRLTFSLDLLRFRPLR